MKCIFCLLEKPPSDEHVIPDSIGGHLHLKEVCADCNSDLSRLVDNPFADCSLIQLARYQHSLGGKRDRIPFPFGGISTLDTGQKVLVNRDFQPHLVRHLETTRREEGGLGVHFSIDAADRDRLEEVLGPLLRKTLTDEFPEWSTEKCLAEVENILSHARAQTPVSEHKPLRKDWTLNLDDLLFEFLKIAYEVWFRHFGYPWVEHSPNARLLRQAILTRDPELPIHGKLFSHGIDLPPSDPSKNHAILLAGGACSIRLFNITCLVGCEMELPEYMLDVHDQRMIINDFTTGTVREAKVSELIMENLPLADPG